MHLDISHTTINMFFFKTYRCFIWSEIAIRKGSTASTTCNVDCSTLQTSRPNHPTTYTHTQTHTQTTVSPCIHSFIHSFNPPYSLYHSFTRTNDASPLPFITIIHQHQPCIARTTQYGIRACTHDVTITRTQWNGMHLHAYRLPTTTLQRYKCMHRDDDFLSPTECADEHLRWWWWWWYWPQSRYSS